MSNPFDRNKTKEARLGQIITEAGEQNQRDAIHIAVIPVIASERIKPGAHVDVVHRGAFTYASTHGIPVGIADPFMRVPIEEGETFWLCLYQGSVNTLRHEWTHDAFPSVAAPVVDKVASEGWVRDFLKTLYSYDYNEKDSYGQFIDGLKEKWITHNLGAIQDREDLRPYEADLVRHLEILTGTKFNFDDIGFSCSC